jgi:hypothetical protein
MLLNKSEIYAGCIEVYKNVISNSEEIINIVEKEDKWKDAVLTNNILNKDIRSNKVFDINQFSYTVNIKLYEMCKTVWEYCNVYAEKYNFHFDYTEPAQILKYAINDEFKPHHDHNKHTPRIFSAVLYLNDSFQGGETEFPLFDLKIKPEVGKLIIFPANYAYQHMAKSPINGEKYSAVFWMG